MVVRFFLAVGNRHVNKLNCQHCVQTNQTTCNQSYEYYFLFIRRNGNLAQQRDKETTIPRF